MRRVYDAKPLVSVYINGYTCNTVPASPVARSISRNSQESVFELNHLHVFLRYLFFILAMAAKRLQFLFADEFRPSSARAPQQGAITVM